MRKLLISIVSVLTVVAGSGFAAQPDADLTPQAAVRLLAIRSSVQEKSIEIPFIIDGESMVDQCFSASHVRRVAAIYPVPKENRRMRRSLLFYDFHWNESLGWFMWESRDERGGEAVYIWSEHKGYIVNR